MITMKDRDWPDKNNHRNFTTYDEMNQKTARQESNKIHCCLVIENETREEN